MLCSKPTKFAMLAAVCLSSNSAAAHQSMPDWSIHISRATAEDDLQIYRLGPQGPGTSPGIGSYTALKICLVDWHGDK
jgi:hypothetical protein